MTKRPEPRETAEGHVKDIRRQTRRKFSSEEKIPIVLEGLRGEHSISELCDVRASLRACKKSFTGLLFNIRIGERPGQT